MGLSHDPIVPNKFRQKKPSNLYEALGIFMINTFLNIDRVPIDGQLYGTYRTQFLLLL